MVSINPVVQPSPQWMRLSENLKNSTVFIELLDPSAIENLSHTTRLPGGFNDLTFEIPTTDSEYLQWRQDRPLAHLELEEHALFTLWEGRLSEVTMPRLGITRLLFKGYWTVFRHHVDDNTGFVKDFSVSADTWITNMLANLSSDEVALTAGSLAAPGVTVDQTYPVEFTYWQALTDTRRGILQFGDTSGNKTDLAVYEDQKVDLTIRTGLSVTWRAFIGDLSPGGVRQLPLSVPFQPVRNAVDALRDTSTRAGYAVDQPSIDKFVRVEHIVPDIGTSGTPTVEARRDEYLEQNKEPQQELGGGIVLDRVYDDDLVEQSLCRVRAGDVLYIPDWLANELDLSSVELDAQRIFFIEETICDHKAGTLTIRPDRERGSVMDMLDNNRIRAKI